MTEPLTWHYGLMAEYWATFSLETPELDFLKKAIERYGQPVLDLACGAGRLLVPLLQAGVDIDGADISADMLAQCQKRAAAAGLQSRLMQQPMHTLTATRRYHTLYICGSFGLAGSRANDIETLRRCYAALEAGGALIVNIESEYSDAESWNSWLPENARKLPEAWPELPRIKIAPDGSEFRLYFRYLHQDPLEFNFTRQVRLEKWAAGKQIAGEEYTLRGDSYLKTEVDLMLRCAGFREITLTGDWTDRPAMADSKELVFTVVK